MFRAVPIGQHCPSEDGRQFLGLISLRILSVSLGKACNVLLRDTPLSCTRWVRLVSSSITHSSDASGSVLRNPIPKGKSEIRAGM